MFCSKCGKEVDGNFKFCAFCGNALQSNNSEISKNKKKKDDIFKVISVIGISFSIAILLTILSMAFVLFLIYLFAALITNGKYEPIKDTIYFFKMLIDDNLLSAFGINIPIHIIMIGAFIIMFFSIFAYFNIKKLKGNK